ncbi:DUF397 domain-containing protein [Pseudonocardia sp. KRD291]|uniref:DUF397 domain-containing protein n=1 Tax=Pseudonocardia sp. KRD291 TaxID=2792007 RepID=UPI001C4A2A80|nr:DUF397 domain-containing protein [Pseudonocardia sp. KRD291]MBW0105410.1 DUF397 domain-containing protein [Pseudonocardia sp. KRD291]
MSQMHPANDVSGGLAWRKSRRSGYQGNCVELATTGGAVAMRNSREPQGAVLAFPAAEMAAFLGAIKNGELDDLA